MNPNRDDRRGNHLEGVGNDDDDDRYNDPSRRYYARQNAISQYDNRRRQDDRGRQTSLSHRGQRPPPSRHHHHQYRSRSRERRGRSHHHHHRHNTRWTLEERHHVQQSGLLVQTNALRVSVSQSKFTWHLYRVDIFHAQRRRHLVVENDSETYILEKIPINSDDHPDDPPQYKMVDNTIRTPLSQQICHALTQTNPKLILPGSQTLPQLIADGSDMAVSLEPLWEVEESSDERTTSTTRAFQVCVARDQTAPDDPDAPYVGTRWWLVEITRLPQTIQFDSTMRQLLQSRLPIIEQYMTTALRSATLSMPTFGINPRQAFLPMPLQFEHNVLGNSLVTKTGGPAMSRPAVSIRSTATVTQDGSFIVKANVLLNHVLPDRMVSVLRPCDNNGRIPLLDSQCWKCDQISMLSSYMVTRY